MNLGQRDRWIPGTVSNVEASAAPTGPFARLGICLPRLDAFVRGWLYIQIMLGWVFATLFVAGLSGVVQTKE